MYFRRTTTLFLVFAVFAAALLCQVDVGAARVLSENFTGGNHLEQLPTTYEKAKYSVSWWLERLASGPSPKGPGH
ncbi:hypothetical protein NMG60_11029982 [Bertholletia excelsa]